MPASRPPPAIRADPRLVAHRAGHATMIDCSRISTRVGHQRRNSRPDSRADVRRQRIPPRPSRGARANKRVRRPRREFAGDGRTRRRRPRQRRTRGRCPGSGSGRRWRSSPTAESGSGRVAFPRQPAVAFLTSSGATMLTSLESRNQSRQKRIARSAPRTLLARETPFTACNESLAPDARSSAFRWLV